MTENPFQAMIDEIVERTGEIVIQKFKELQGAEIADRLYSPEQACKTFHPAISKQTLKKWSDDGLIQYKKLGGRVFYKYSDLMDAGAHLQKYKRVV